MRVYFDNAASTPLAPEVLEAMMPYFTEIQGNPSSIHHHGRQVRAAVETARTTIAELIGASPSEIFFTGGGTEADNMAIRGSVSSFGLKHAISTEIEHHAVTHTLEYLEKEGKIRFHKLSTDRRGNIDLKQLEGLLALNDSPSLVSLMHANNEIGTMINLQEIGDLCKKYKALFHSDTVQTMGHVAFNLRELPVHFVTGAAHKFNGPKGIGFLYVKEDIKIPAMITGGSQERNMRAGTENVPGIIGMAKALQMAYEHLEEKTSHLLKLKNYLKNRLESEIPGIQFNGETESENSLATVLNVRFPGIDEESMLLYSLDIYQISASGGSACTSGSNVGSHVLKGIGLSTVEAANSIRFSFGYQNNLSEIDYLIEKLKQILISVTH
jgi:cysteine desulfurase